MRNDIYNSFMHNDIENICFGGGFHIFRWRPGGRAFVASPYGGEPHESSPLPYGRAPKGSIYLLGGGAYGRACLRILSD